MNHDVSWLPTAEQELAALWVDGANRAAVTRAANVIDDRLSREGLSAGESRDAGRRIIFEPPLVAIFRKSKSGRIEVLHVHRIRRRGASP